MKKFVFTLESVLKFKITTEKRQKADLAKIMALLARLYAQEKELDLAFLRTEQSQMRVLKERLNIAVELPRHAEYFLHIRQEKAELKKRIDAAHIAKEKCQKALIKTMNEIKTLEKLKDEQYEAYLEEVRAEEAKDIGDLISYKSIAE